MRALAAAVVILLIVAGAPAWAAPGPSTWSFVTRSPIAISQDAHFSAANGVVSGTGTPADPFVISGWHINAGAGTAISITNTTVSWIVRDNLLEGAVGVSVTADRGDGVVSNNKIMVRATGILLREADPLVADNSLIRDACCQTATGILLQDSNARVQGNFLDMVSFAIQATRGSPRILENNVHKAGTGIALYWTTAATLESNTVTESSVRAVYDHQTILSTHESNLVWSCQEGLVVWQSKDVSVSNNTVRYCMKTGVFLETVSGAVTGNVVLDGHANALNVWGSAVRIANNTLDNNLATGMLLSMSGADVYDNRIFRSSVGISLSNGDTPHLVGNVLANNTVGLDVPYAARQAIPRMHGNFVNGVNVDGALVPGDRMMFYREANVHVLGGVRDSGFSQGYYGALTAQGGIVLYEVDTAWILGTHLSHHTIGVGLVNSFNVNVANSSISNTGTGVLAQVATGVGLLPPGVLTVKDSLINVTIDPVGSIGIDSRGYMTNVLRSHISLVDVGIRLDGASTGLLDNNTVVGTKIALDVAGRPGEVAITSNAILENRLGARLTGYSGLVAWNRFEANEQAAATLSHGTRLDLRGNNVTGNGQGLVDLMPCLSGGSCAAVTSEFNTFLANRGVGLRVNGTSTLRGDQFLGNRGDGAEMFSGTVRGVTSSGNEGNGLVMRGTFVVRDSTFAGNDGNGVVLVGNGDIQDSAFVHNRAAGLRMSATYVTAHRINASFNFDGIVFDELLPPAPAPPALPQPNVPDVLRMLDDLTRPPPEQDPMDVHRSSLFGNERDAIRAGNAIVNATHNWFGGFPMVSLADQVGAYRNGVSPAVRTIPYYTDEGMTRTGPLPFL